ncbi:hypothetical protein [Amycolatopsis rhizosphaerae]|uniref:hypothetical protein n=1 Tax=Amycolatopsis rhizosphaerae TaxID=2053003 RepID=UPI001FE69144|nr:hypothetical protein [Amycolatopsis rhizosphaerae]
MATTTDEIQRRVEEADTARSAKRSEAARQVGELAQRRAAVAAQLEDIERQLGDVLAGAQEVIDIDELARFTDVPAADLTRWLTARTTSRPKRKRSPGRAPGELRTEKPNPASAVSEPRPRASTVSNGT